VVGGGAVRRSNQKRSRWSGRRSSIAVGESNQKSPPHGECPLQSDMGHDKSREDLYKVCHRKKKVYSQCTDRTGRIAGFRPATDGFLAVLIPSTPFAECRAMPRCCCWGWGWCSPFVFVMLVHLAAGRGGEGGIYKCLKGGRLTAPVWEGCVHCLLGGSPPLVPILRTKKKKKQQKNNKKKNNTRCDRLCTFYNPAQKTRRICPACTCACDALYSWSPLDFERANLSPREFHPP